MLIGPLVIGLTPVKCHGRLIVYTNSSIDSLYFLAFASKASNCSSLSHTQFNLKPSDVNNIEYPAFDVKTSPTLRILQTRPINTAVYAGDNATFYCSSQPGSGARIQWWEWTSSSTPQLISDQDLFTRHPNGNRYQIEHPDNESYNLRMTDVEVGDAGSYSCVDAGFGPPCVNASAEQSGNRASANLIVFSEESKYLQ